MIVFLLKQRSDFNFISMVCFCVLQKGMTNKNSTTAVRTGYLQCMTGAFQGIDKSLCLPLKFKNLGGSVIVTLNSLISVCIFSMLFTLQVLWHPQREFV